MVFFLGIFTTSTNPKGIIVGIVISQVILVLKLVGIIAPGVKILCRKPRIWLW